MSSIYYSFQYYPGEPSKYNATIYSRCNICTNSTSGEFCESCADGYYGDAVDGTCQPCNCFLEGAVSAQCDQRGRCKCRGAIKGDKCDQCNVSFCLPSFISPHLLSCC